MKCPAGHYCQSADNTAGTNPDGLLTPCAAGTYSGGNSLAASTDCKACSPGHYCLEGSVFPTPCAAGTHNVSPSSTSDAACTNCGAGYVCPFLGNKIGHTQGFQCEPGYYCEAGSSEFYATPIPAGSYNDWPGRENDSTFTESCPEKYACPAGTNTLTQPMVPCAAGHVCSGGNTAADEEPCLAGTYSPRTDLTNTNQCETCPAG